MLLVVLEKQKEMYQSKNLVNKYFILFACWIMALWSLPTKAQNVNFTQFGQAPAQTNPAMIATSNQTQVIFNYRSQYISAGPAFETPMISLIYPIIKRESMRRAAVGLSVMQDKTGEGGLLTTTGALLTAAYNFQLAQPDSNRQYIPFLSVGAQGGFFQRRVNEGVLTSDNQWNGTFVPSLGLGEPIIDSDLFNASLAFPLFNAGLFFYTADLCGRVKAYVGLGVQNMNQPNVAFFAEQDKLVPLYTAIAGYGFDIQDKFTIQPNLRYLRQAGASELRIGSMFYYNFGFGEGFLGEGNAGVGFWYDSNSDVILTLQVNQPKYSIGFSYDMGAFSSTKVTGSGAFEVSLGIKFGKRCLKTGPPRDKEYIMDTTVVEVQTPLGDSLYTLVSTIDGREVLKTDTIDRKFVPDESATVRIPTEDDLKVFKRKAFFYYVSDDINKATAALLEEIVTVMQLFKGIKIELAGHTCNIGASEGDNEALAIRRATAVREFLTKRGIDPARITMTGFGSTRPILSNKTEYGRIKNRRVEFEVLETGGEGN